ASSKDRCHKSRGSLVNSAYETLHRRRRRTRRIERIHRARPEWTFRHAPRAIENPGWTRRHTLPTGLLNEHRPTRILPRGLDEGTVRQLADRLHGAASFGKGRHFPDR